MTSMTPIRSTNRANTRRGSLLSGCLIALAVVVILAVAGGIYAWTQWRGVAASLATRGITAVVEQLELSDEDEQLILTRVDELAEDFKAKNVTVAQLLEVATNLAESPLKQAVAVYAVEKNYFEDSGLSVEEKADASLQLGRLARGVYEEKISYDEMQEAMDEIVVQSIGNDTVTFREPETVDDDDLRRLISKVKAAADEAEIPNEPFEIDIAAEFIKAIDEALGVATEAPAQLPEDPAEGDEGGEETGEEGAGKNEEGGGG